MGAERGTGDVVAGRYRIVRRLGRGGSARTYEAEPVAGGAHVALKEIQLAGAEEWKHVELFEREARVLANLSHRAIPRYIEHFTEDEGDRPTFVLVQELAPGKPLSEWVGGGLRFDEAAVRAIALEVLRVLRYLHGLTPPVIHRDLKPQNILQAEDGRVFVVDFGAVRDGLRAASGGSTVVGTYGYMGPEQLQGQAFPASDLYGLATTLVFLLTGKAPSELPHKKLRVDVRAGVPASPALQRWLEKMLAPAPEDRFLSATAAVDALTKPGPRDSRARVAGLLGALALAGGGAAFVLFPRPNRPSPIHAGTAIPPAVLPLPARPPAVHFGPVHHVRSIPAHNSVIYGEAFTPDGKSIVTCSADGTVKLWDVESGAPIRAFPGHTGMVESVKISPDGRLVVSGGGPNVKAWELATAAPVFSLDADSKRVMSVAISPDGATIAAAGGDGVVKEWSSNGQLARSMSHSPGQAVAAIAFSPDGRLLASVGFDRTAKIWRSADGGLERTLTGFTRTLGAVAFAPDGKTLFTGGDDHLAQSWNLRTGAPLATFHMHTDEVWSLAVSPSGALLVTGGKDGWLAMWDPMKGTLRENLWPKVSGTYSMTFSNDGAYLATGQGAGMLEIWRAAPSPTAPLPTFTVDDPDGGTTDLGAAATDPSARAYAEADLRTDRYDLEGAKTGLRAIVAAHPKYALAYAGLARIAFKEAQSPEGYDKAKLEEAASLADQALALDSQNAEALVVRGWVYLGRNEWKRARRQADAALQASPGYVRALLLSARLEAVRKPDDAEREARAALEKSHRLVHVVDALQTLVVVYEGHGDYASVERLHQKIIELQPNAYNLGRYAELLTGLGRYDEAAVVAERALSLGKDHDAMPLARARLQEGYQSLWGRGDVEAARAAFLKAADVAKAFGPPHYGLGACHQWAAVKQGKPAELADAKREYQTALLLDPSLRTAKDALATLP